MNESKKRNRQQCARQEEEAHYQSLYGEACAITTQYLDGKITELAADEALFNLDGSWSLADMCDYLTRPDEDTTP